MVKMNSYMNVKEACKTWGVTRTTVKRWCAEGKVKCDKAGHLWIIVKDQPNPKKWGMK